MYREVLDDIKLRYQNLANINGNIKKRATQLLSFVGISMAAATGIVLVESIITDTEKIIGIIGVIIMSIALAFCLWITKTHGVLAPISSDMLLNVDSKKSRLNADPKKSELNDKYNTMVKMEQNIYYRLMSERYLKCLRDEENINKKLARLINGATISFIIGIVVYISPVVLSRI